MYFSNIIKKLIKTGRDDLSQFEHYLMGQGMETWPSFGRVLGLAEGREPTNGSNARFEQYLIFNACAV